MKKIRPASVIGKTGKWALIILLAIFEIFPLIQLLFNSFRPDAEIKAHPLGLPTTWTLENYADTWVAGGYAASVSEQHLDLRVDHSDYHCCHQPGRICIGKD